MNKFLSHLFFSPTNTWALSFQHRYWRIQLRRIKNSTLSDDFFCYSSCSSMLATMYRVIKHLTRKYDFSHSWVTAVESVSEKWLMKFFNVQRIQLDTYLSRSDNRRHTHRSPCRTSSWLHRRQSCHHFLAHFAPLMCIWCNTSASSHSHRETSQYRWALARILRNIEDIWWNEKIMRFFHFTPPVLIWKVLLHLSITDNIDEFFAEAVPFWFWDNPISAAEIDRAKLTTRKSTIDSVRSILQDCQNENISDPFLCWNVALPQLAVVN